MKHSVVRSLVRGFITGWNGNHCIMMVRRFEAAEMGHCGCGGFYWGRMMASAPLTDKKESSVTEAEAKEKDNSVAVPSYWGVSRPKIRREDGKEWPWNCFMVCI